MLSNTKFLIASISLFILLVLFTIDSSISCEPEKYPPAPEITWPLNESESVPLDSAIIIKDFKLPSKNPIKLDIEILDSAQNSVSFTAKRIQSRRSVYNYEAGFIFITPDDKFKPLENYTLTVRASTGFELPINQKITFTIGDENTLVTTPEKIDVSYYFSEPGYYLSNCQTATWDKATSLVFVDSKIEGYPIILVLHSNLLKDISFYHSSIKKRDLAALFLPNEKGLDQCFNLDGYSISGEKFFEDKLCKPSRCTKGEHLTKEEAQAEFEKHGAFGFSMIRFPITEELPNYCTLYPPMCREYWASIPDNSCSSEN